MRLLTFTDEGRTSWGVLTAHGVVEPTRADPTLPSSVGDLLAAGAPEFDRVGAVVERATTAHALRDIRLCAPIPRPGKIMCIGRNYSDHVAETAAFGRPRTERPSLFLKAASNVVGTGTLIRATSTSSIIRK
jgi:2-keto-4-pentenoate hydratase/2-oxohepta-3-ene-1,7-dioic acid hydratase in catechol pathway